MNHCDLSQAEQKKRREIAEHTRKMILSELVIERLVDLCRWAGCGGDAREISFSELHPLLVFCLAKALEKPSTDRQRQMTNELNLHSILGSHAINDEVGCYSYRATQWLDAELDAPRFFEILDRCVDEADRGFYKLAG